MSTTSKFISDKRIKLIDSYTSDVFVVDKFDYYPFAQKWYIPWTKQSMLRVPDNHQNLMIVFKVGISTTQAVTFSDMYSALAISENDYDDPSQFKNSIVYSSVKTISGTFFNGPGYHLAAFVLFIGPASVEYKSGFITDNEIIYGSKFPELGIFSMQYRSSLYTNAVTTLSPVPKRFYHTVQFTSAGSPPDTTMATYCKIYSLE